MQAAASLTAVPFSSAVPLVIDASAWSRQRNPAVRERWYATNEVGLFASCPAAALEIFRTARNETEFAGLQRHFALLPQASITASVCRAALTAAGELRGSRRLPATDYLIAAAAAEKGFGVLHADRHFDLLATVLPFESVRLPD
jgi:predicted nucleic acid-binding protein